MLTKQKLNCNFENILTKQRLHCNFENTLKRVTFCISDWWSNKCTHIKSGYFLPYLSSIHEKAMYRYVLDGKFALAWELPFPSHLSSAKRWGVPLSALPKDTTSELAGLFSTTFHNCRAPSREAIDTIF